MLCILEAVDGALCLLEVMEVLWMHGVWRLAAVMQTWRYGALEERCRNADVEEWSCGGLEARCRCGDAEI